MSEYDLYGGTPPHVARDTSYAAAESVRYSAEAMRRQIFEEIVRRGYHGLTCDEAEVIFSMRHQTASARIRELVLKDLVFDSERRRLTRSNRPAIVWIEARFRGQQPMSEEKKPTPKKYTPAENDGKLYNVIRIWDVYVYARGPEAAQECLDTWIKQENLAPSEATALPVTRDPEVRERWREEKPLVAADITDEEFETMAKGRTTIQLFDSLFKRHAK